MTWLITGAGGQVATHLLLVLRAVGVPAVALPHAELDITSAASVASALDRHQPSIVVNAAAYTAVDAAEADAATAHRVNAEGPGVLAAALGSDSARLIHLSTDYVFDGAASTPDEVDSPTGLRTVYAQTRLAASTPDRQRDAGARPRRRAGNTRLVGRRARRAALRRRGHGLVVRAGARCSS